MKHYSPLFFLLSTICFLFSCSSSEKKLASTSGYILPDSLLADYEKRIDHKKYLIEPGEEAFELGEQIYNRNCFNCHGNPEQVGSIPNAFKFWKDNFKNGNDPYQIYQTISRGYGMMPPQTTLVPEEKYAVIQYIREALVKDENPSQYFEIDSSYVASLPPGNELGPDPIPYEPWAEMDYGNFLINTYEIADINGPPKKISGGPSPLPNEDYKDVNFAYKGIAMRLDPGEGGIAAGAAWAIFDQDLMRIAGIWTGEKFIDWQGILLDGRHNVYPRTGGKLHLENPVGPAWAEPSTGTFNDPRFKGLDGRPFGPLPPKWAHYKGLYKHEGKTILFYTIGKAVVLETMSLVRMDPDPVFSRTLNINADKNDLLMRIAPIGTPVSIKGEGASLIEKEGFILLKVDKYQRPRISLLIGSETTKDIQLIAKKVDAPMDLNEFLLGGESQDPQILESEIVAGEEDYAYTVDVLGLPQNNPFKSRMRMGGLEFIPETDDALVCTVEGEVWRVSGITQKNGKLTWRRITTGLFQPLGIKIRNGEIFVSCRNEIVQLQDLNGDGEIDFHRSFNNDHQVTEHFHEFAMGLQTDEEGNFYYAKSARHARTPLVPHHGTLLRVSADGSTTDIVAKGFRAANGVCRNPDGSFIVTDQEGHWNPMNRINWVTEGGFYGNMYGYGAPEDTSNEAMIAPLCWVDKTLDRSPSELVWADSEKFGPLNGALLNLSYGYGKVFSVLHEFKNEQAQGGLVRVPIPAFPTGVMRARFHPEDGQMYACGLNAWGSNQVIQDGGIYRVRYTGMPAQLPTSLTVHDKGIEISFSEAIDPSFADPIYFTAESWELKRTHFYGSKRYNEKEWAVTKVSMSDDQKTLLLTIPEISPCWAVEITYDLADEKGNKVKGFIQQTIHHLESEKTM